MNDSNGQPQGNGFGQPEFGSADPMQGGREMPPLPGQQNGMPPLPPQQADADLPPLPHDHTPAQTNGYGIPPQQHGAQQQSGYGVPEQATNLNPGAGEPTTAAFDTQSAYPASPGGHGAVASANPAHPVTQRRRNRAGLIAAIAAVVVLVLGIGTWGVLALTSRGGASDPAQAARQTIERAVDADIIGLSQVIAPSELGIIGGPMLELVGSEESGNDDLGIASLEAAFTELNAAGEVSLDGFSMESRELTPDVAVVTLKKGEITIEGDTARYNTALKELTRTVVYERELLNGATPDRALEAANWAVEDQVEIALPHTISLGDLREQTHGLAVAPELVAVKEDGRWYTSPIMSGANAAMGAVAGQSSTNATTVLDASPANSPEEAGMQFTEALVNDVASVFSNGGDISSTIETLATPERRLLSLFVQPLFERNQFGGGPGQSSITVTASGGFERIDGHGVTMILPDGLELTVAGERDALKFDGYCVEVPGSSAPSCLTDQSAFTALGLDTVGLVVVKENGGWVVSVYETARVAATVAAQHYIELRENNQLHLLSV